MANMNSDNDNNTQPIQGILPFEEIYDMDEQASYRNEAPSVQSEDIRPYSEQRLAQLKRYRNSGQLDPKKQPILDEIIETYKACGYLYKETLHVLDLIERAGRWLVLTIACTIVLFCFIVLGSRDINPIQDDPILYFVMIGICTIWLLACIDILHLRILLVSYAKKIDPKTAEAQEERKQTIARAVKDVVKWIPVLLYSILTTTLCVMLQFLESPLMRERPLLYFGLIGVLVIQSFGGLIAMLRAAYRHIHEVLTIDLSVVTLEYALNKWLALPGGGGEWPTRNYSAVIRGEKTLVEQWIAKRSQTATIELPGSKDAEKLHNRRHTKDVERLSLALEVSAWMSRAGHDDVGAIYG